MDSGTLWAVGLALVFVGVLIMWLAVLLMFFLRSKTEDDRKESKVEVRGGGAIIIGPIPIIFGTDRKSLKTILLLSITLTILLIILAVVIYFISR